MKRLGLPNFKKKTEFTKLRSQDFTNWDLVLYAKESVFTFNHETNEQKKTSCVKEKNFVVVFYLLVI